MHNEEEEHKCNFCEGRKLQDYRIPMSKMSKLFLNDFYQCKFDAEMAEMKR